MSNMKRLGKILKNTVQKSGVIFAVTYTYTGYPMVRQMREMIANGDISNFVILTSIHCAIS